MHVCIYDCDYSIIVLLIFEVVLCSLLNALIECCIVIPSNKIKTANFQNVATILNAVCLRSISCLNLIIEANFKHILYCIQYFGDVYKLYYLNRHKKKLIKSQIEKR